MTRKLVAILVVALASLSGSAAQNSTRTHWAGDVAQVLLDLENKWVEALVKSDTATLDAILADTFVDTDEEGNQADKGGVIAALKSGDLKMASIKLSEMHVRVYGDLAVVTGMAAQTGAFRGQSLVPRIVFTDSFILQNGKWRAVASHRTAVHGR
jgi:ketosteroid isomerase-like protein